jgi:ubiquinone/menaquinone biosynthesis C-methylase UbiE
VKRDNPRFATINGPFGSARNSARLVFDFGAMISCFNDQQPNERVLDFGAGTGWISEWLNRIGYDVYAIDINPDIDNVINLRIDNDLRIQRERIRFETADGHDLPFSDELFGHIVCFDSLHHMKDYHGVLSEMHRVLSPAGRAVFVEPGAKHSTSKETKEFLRKYKADDPERLL